MHHVKFAHVLCLAGLLGISSAWAQARNGEPKDPNARDLVLISQWFEGEFDNEEQQWFENDARSQTPADRKHERIHTIHKRIDAPVFGPVVFYVEEYRDNDPGKVIRQRLVTFSSNMSAATIRMQQGFLKDAKAALGAHLDPAKLAKLKLGDVSFLPGCDVTWRRIGDQFAGAMASKTCQFGEGKDRRYSAHNLVLSAAKYWREDRSFRVSDDTLFLGYPTDEPHKFNRAKIFICEITFRGEKRGEKEQKVEGLRLHSQGGQVWGVRADGREIGLRLRDKEYPYYDVRPDFLFFAVREKGNEASLAYSIHDVTSRRLGIDLGWMGAHCARDGYTFQEPIAALPR
jgi:CpeT/CpcT family (DUF1001)